MWATDVTFSYADYKGQGTSNTGSSYTMEKTDVNITNSKFYCGSSASYAQFYANGTTTITPASGVTITSVVLTASATGYNGYQSSGTITASVGSVSGSTSSTTVTWTGSETAEFTITNNKQIRWTSIVVTYTKSGETPTCATPTFSPDAGAYINAQNVTITCATEGATIYYTTNGDDPTTGSSVYSAPIAVSANTTIKALAAKTGCNNSTIATAAYTFPTTTYNSVADLIAAAPTETVILNLTDAQVLAKGGNDMYVKDASGALDFYQLGFSYTAGQILNGKIVVTSYKVYKNVPEITGVGDNQLVATEGVLAPIEIALADATYANYNCQLVKVTGDVTESKKMGDLILYNKFSGMTETVLNNLIPGVNNITVTGIIIPYNSDTEICPTAIDYNITLTKDMMAYAGGNKLDYTESGLTVYTAKVTNGAAVLTELADNNTGLKVVNNGTGVILSGTEGNTYVAHVTTENVSATSGNELKGVTAETVIDWQIGESPNYKYNYILQNGVFKKATGAKLKAGKAYLSTTFDVTAAGAPELKIVFDGGTTGINAVQGSEFKVNGQFYDLQGRKVANPTKGLYIVNGKKVIVK